MIEIFLIAVVLLVVGFLALACACGKKMSDGSDNTLYTVVAHIMLWPTAYYVLKALFGGLNDTEPLVWMLIVMSTVLLLSFRVYKLAVKSDRENAEREAAKYRADSTPEPATPEPEPVKPAYEKAKAEESNSHYFPESEPEPSTREAFEKVEKDLLESESLLERAEAACER